MTGDDRTRRCDQCNLNVHNISAMTRQEGEAFLARTFHADGRPIVGRVCARFYRRADGTILTADCPVGLAALRAKARRAAARFAAAIGFTTLIAWAAARESAHTPFATTQPMATLAAWLKQPASPPVMMGKIATMGDIAVPPPPQPIQAGSNGAIP